MSLRSTYYVSRHCLPRALRAPDERAGRMLLFSSTTSLVGGVGEAGAAGAGGPSSELEVRAMRLQAFEVLDHGMPRCGKQARYGQPSRLHQRQRAPGAAPRCGQPRPSSLLGRAGSSTTAADGPHKSPHKSRVAPVPACPCLAGDWPQRSCPAPPTGHAPPEHSAPWLARHTSAYSRTQVASGACPCIASRACPCLADWPQDPCPPPDHSAPWLARQTVAYASLPQAAEACRRCLAPGSRRARRCRRQPTTSAA